jgi:hypothetical protein
VTSFLDELLARRLVRLVDEPAGKAR